LPFDVIFENSTFGTLLRGATPECRIGSSGTSWNREKVQALQFLTGFSFNFLLACPEKSAL
jgi:hypothetical protein